MSKKSKILVICAIVSLIIAIVDSCYNYLLVTHSMSNIIDMVIEFIILGVVVKIYSVIDKRGKLGT